MSAHACCQMLAVELYVSLRRAEREAREDATALRARADAATDLRAAAAAAEDRERAARDQAQALAQVPALCRRIGLRPAF